MEWFKGKGERVSGLYAFGGIDREFQCFILKKADLLISNYWYAGPFPLPDPSTIKEPFELPEWASNIYGNWLTYDNSWCVYNARPKLVDGNWRGACAHLPLELGKPSGLALFEKRHGEWIRVV